MLRDIAWSTIQYRIGYLKPRKNDQNSRKILSLISWLNTTTRFKTWMTRSAANAQTLLRLLSLAKRTGMADFPSLSARKPAGMWGVNRSDYLLLSLSLKYRMSSDTLSRHRIEVQYTNRNRMLSLSATASARTCSQIAPRLKCR